MARLSLLLLIMLCSLVGITQQIQIQSTVDAEVEVCQNAQVHEVYIQNLTGSTLTGVTVTVDLPQGITYVTSSVLNLGSGVAVESNVADLNSPVFSAGDIAHGDSLKFSFEFKAGMDAIAWQDAGNLFRNNVQVSTNESAADQLSPSYNILYPVLTILDVSPTTQTMLSGGGMRASFPSPSSSVPKKRNSFSETPP